jgi:predicted small lipoprotein YifL
MKRVFLHWVVAAAAAAVLAACGGGGSGGTSTASSTPPGTGTTSTSPSTGTNAGTTTTASTGTAGGTSTAATVAAAVNVLPITVDRGADGTALDAPFVSVTVCVPGTQDCRTVDHILVDTGSVGLRLSANAIPALSLPALGAPNGNAYGECASFASGYTWGSVHSADVHLAGEQANAIPIQIYNDSAPVVAKVPTACSNTGVPLDPAGSNGVLGVGFQTRDCGTACTSSTLPAMYYSCTGSGCTGAIAPLSSQVGNPAALLQGSDNNGVAVMLPDIPLGGVSSLSGSLILGIGTHDNNQLSGLGVFNANSAGNFSTTYKGRTSSAFIDSGSNGVFFADSSIPLCGSGFYCPPSPLTLSATVSGSNGASRSVSFVVENAGALPSGTAAAHIGGSVVLGRSFDWGMPFFLGRTVFVGFAGMSTPAGFGPFWAF